MKTIRHNTRKDGQKRPFEKQKRNTSYSEKDTTTRLNKYIAYTGLCSRRDADELIKRGKISVNGKIVTEMGIKIDLFTETLLPDLIFPVKNTFGIGPN